MRILGCRFRDAYICRTNTGSSLLAKCGLLFCILVYSIVPAAAQYQIGVGDVIEISVARVPELQRRVAVRSDGTISFPLLGNFPVAGLSISEVESRIQANLATRVFRQRSPDGQEHPVTIEADEVTASVAQYRPIYVSGDVSKPGEQSFRPFMTVREAVALAGGYDILRVKTENPILISADLKGEYQSLRIELAKMEANILRLKTELGERSMPEPAPGTEMADPQSPIAQIMQVEREQLKTEQADYEKQKLFLQRSITQSDEHIKILSAQEAREKQGMQADAEELERVVELSSKGLLPSPRVTDARRALLLSSTRNLQTAAQLMQVKKQQDDIARDLQRLDDLRRIKLLQELQDAGAQAAQIQLKMRTAAEKLQYMAARSLLAGVSKIKSHIAIIRKDNNARKRLDADEDTELHPGDVVDVALELNDGPASGSLKSMTGPAGIEKGNLQTTASDATRGLSAAVR
ncbi:MAG TPA: polysaccharide biosynthesis/export family protein [Pseudolabrys sp.]|nr:polysaccharide biosynthesis/export family protein [Pseudolabrys sp.]